MNSGLGAPFFLLLLLLLAVGSGAVLQDRRLLRDRVCDVRVAIRRMKSESTCAFCHHLVDEVLSKMKDPDAQFEIIQLLIKECNKVQGHVQQCKRMVLEYVPLILMNGEKFLEKKDVCTLMQACDATSQKRKAGSILDSGLRSDE